MKPTLALSMILKDGAKDLAACLDSVRGIVDEIVIADTGSSDNGIAIAQSYGARIIHIPWQDDFSAARNAALQETKSDWVLVLDDDEMLDGQAAPQITAALQRSNVFGYQVTIRNYVYDMSRRLWDKAAQPNDSRLQAMARFPGFLQHQNVRLFRKHPAIYFERRVHETVGDRVRALGALEETDFVIHHTGLALTAEEKVEKNEFYFRLGQQKLEEMPQSAQAHFELGLMELDYKHRPSAAQKLFARACELNPEHGVFWFFNGQALIQLERPLEAIPCLKRSRQLGGINTASCLDGEGDAYSSAGQFAEARRSYRQLLALGDNPEVLSKLGLTEVRLGHAAAGLEKLSRAAATGKSAVMYDRLIGGLASTGKIAEAARAAEEKLNAVSHTASSFLRAAVLWAHAKNDGRALEIINNGIKEFPESMELQRVSAELARPLVTV